MLRFWPGGGALLAFVFHAAVASAQVQLTPAVSLKWDAAVQLAWTSVDSRGVGVSSPRYDSAAVSGSAGILLTRHLKATFGAAYTGDGSVYGSTVRSVPGTTPVYIYSEHRLRATTVNSSIGSQFFENRWVHPSIAAGIQIAHETHRIDTQGPFFDRPPTVSSSTSRQITVSPFVGAGVKFYMAERAFIQTNVDVTLNTRGAQRVTWATGVGFDF